MVAFTLRPLIAALVLISVGVAQEKPEPKPDDTEYLAVRFAPDGRFGLTVTNDPKNEGKRLTFAPDGTTNSTIVRINGRDFLLHNVRTAPFKVTAPAKVTEEEKEALGRKWSAEWQVASPAVVIEQTVLLRRGPQSAKFDTAVVQYALRNKGKVKVKLGLRFMLDVLIGGNDGVPFAVPEQPNLVFDRAAYKGKQVPDYVQAFEKPDITNPGTIAHLGIRLSGSLGSAELPDALQIAAWPDPDTTGWNIPHQSFGQDSMVGLYWEEKFIDPGEERQVGFSYGLAKVSSGGSKGKMGLTAGGAFKAGGTVVVTAYLDKNLRKPSVTLKLPEGLTLAKGLAAKQAVNPKPGDPYGRATWRVVADKPGTFEVKAELDDGATEVFQIVIK